MIYWQVLPEADQIQVKNNFLVKKELYTVKQAVKMGANPKHFKLVSVSKNKTFYFFGARFTNAI